MTGPTVPNEAIEAAVRAYIAPDILESAPQHQHIWREAMTAALAAAVPVLRSQVANEIADDISSQRDAVKSVREVGNNYDSGVLDGLEMAEQTARSFAVPEGETP